MLLMAMNNEPKKEPCAWLTLKSLTCSDMFAYGSNVTPTYSLEDRPGLIN